MVVSPVAIFVSLFCLAVIALSTLDCFHVHYGVAASLEDLQLMDGSGDNNRNGKQIFNAKRGFDTTNGIRTEYVDVQMKVQGTIRYDEDAKVFLKEHPEVILSELDLGFVVDGNKELGANISMGEDGKTATLSSTFGGHVGSASANAMKSGRASIGRPTNEPFFYVTGKKIRDALRVREDRMPKPSSYSSSSSSTTMHLHSS